ncbi:MAG: type IV pilus secretin PilQ [Deltaproteobacteria bacterium]|nr:type IV pilus secretin PilQ [Deltaproteobacteria bacterium]
MNNDITKPLEPKTIKAISVTESDESFDVDIEGNRLLTYTSVKKPVPLSVVLYFPETVLDNVQRDLTLDNAVIGSVMATELTAEGTATRIEILMNSDVSYEVVRRDNGINIAFSKTAADVSTMNAEKAEPVVDQAAAAGNATPVEPVVVATVQGASAESEQTVQRVEPVASETTVAAGTTDDTAWVNRIDFASEEAGKSTIIIGTTGPVKYDIKKSTDTKILLKLTNANLPEYRRFPLITTRFESAVNRIVPVQKPEMKNNTMFVIELRESVPYSVEQIDNLIMIHFEASTIPPKPLEQANMPPWQQVFAETSMQDMAATPAAAETAGTAAGGQAMVVGAARQSDASMPRQTAEVGLLRGKPKVYTGEKIALDFYETDVKNVFRILKEISGKNFAIDKDVSGRVTLTLDKPVPWDQVLDLVLRMNQLGMVDEGNIIRIATLKTLKSEEDLRAAKIKAAQEAMEQEKALEPLMTEYIAVNYSNAQTEILPHIQSILTPERGSVSVDTRNNQIIITDVAAKLKQAREIVKRIDRVTPQVIIEARIAEVSTDFSQELGFDWTATAGPAYNSRLNSNLTGDMVMNFPAEGASSSLGFVFDKIGGTPFLLNARLNALESNGEGKVISSPKIVTLDNKKAKIKQGVEWPYLERDDAGGSSVSYKDIDLLLEVTPHVTPDNRVSMEILITKNDIDSLFQGVPSLSTNEAQTELLVNDGDTIVIGGIMKTRRTTGVDGFPWLSKIPVLGWFFKTETESRENNELLIFITPRIVQLEQREAL